MASSLNVAGARRSPPRSTAAGGTAARPAPDELQSFVRASSLLVSKVKTGAAVTAVARALAASSSGAPGGVRPHELGVFEGQPSFHAEHHSVVRGAVRGGSVASLHERLPLAATDSGLPAWLEDVRVRRAGRRGSVANLDPSDSVASLESPLSSYVSLNGPAAATQPSAPSVGHAGPATRAQGARHGALDDGSVTLSTSQFRAAAVGVLASSPSPDASHAVAFGMGRRSQSHGHSHSRSTSILLQSPNARDADLSRAQADSLVGGHGAPAPAAVGGVPASPIQLPLRNPALARPPVRDLSPTGGRRGSASLSATTAHMTKGAASRYVPGSRHEASASASPAASPAPHRAGHGAVVSPLLTIRTKPHAAAAAASGGALRAAASAATASAGNPGGGASSRRGSSAILSALKALRAGAADHDAADGGSADADAGPGISLLPGRVAAAVRRRLVGHRNPGMQFNSTNNAVVFFGSTIALESLDGWFLTVHPKTGIVSVREPEPRWYQRGIMPFRRTTLPTGEVREAPHYLFRIINLKNPLANGPVHHGDPIWLQVCEGRGDDGWQSGSVLAPYVQQAIELDHTAVDIEGYPPGYSHYKHLGEHDVEGEWRAPSRSSVRGRRTCEPTPVTTALFVFTGVTLCRSPLCYDLQSHAPSKHPLPTAPCSACLAERQPTAWRSCSAPSRLRRARMASGGAPPAYGARHPRLRSLGAAAVS